MDVNTTTPRLLREIALRMDVDRLRQIKGGAVLAEAIRRSRQQSTDAWTDYTKHTNQPSWSNYSAHAKTIKK